jgi:GT2 family glycosyltransferase
VIVDNHSTNNSVEKIVDWLSGDCDYTFTENPLGYVNASVPSDTPFTMISEQQSLSIDTNSSFITLINAEENQGFGAGNNIGIRLALKDPSCSYIWTLNNDTIVGKESLDNLTLALKRWQNAQQNIGYLTHKILCYDKKNTIQSAGGKYFKWSAYEQSIGAGQQDCGQYDSDLVNEEISYTKGASVFFERKTLEKLNGWTEDYFLYFEEMDLNARARKLGIAFGYCYDILVFHKEGASVGNDGPRGKSDIADYYGVVNRFKLTRRFYPIALPSVTLLYFAAIAKRLILGEFRRAYRLLTFSPPE